MSRMWPAYADYTAHMASPSRLAAARAGKQGKYRLLLYREGYLQPQPDAFPPTGQPALFVPGNAGSYGQVRSVASSTAHQYWSHDYAENPSAFAGRPRPEWANLTARGIDWWTIDFNEDFSALHGDTLVEQAVFVNEAIVYLQSIYPDGPVKVPILAHSMGGIVSRLAMALPEHPPRSVDTLVTLSTPHAYPALAFDDGIARVYRTINAVSALPDAPLLVSIAGGALDVQVSSDAANVAVSPVWKGESISISSNAIPGAWCSMDHLAIMWCDQIRTRVATGFLQSGLPDYARQRKVLWLKALGLANGQAAFLPDDETSEQATGVSEITLDYIPNESVLSLVSNTAPSTVFQVRLCHQPVGGPCYILPNEWWQLMPPSPEYALEFPDPVIKYGTPGKGLWHAYLPVAQLRELSIQQVFIERLSMDLGTFMEYAFGSAATEATEILVSDLMPYTRVRLPSVDSSLKAYELTVAIPPQHCLPPTSYKIAFQPFLRLSSLSSLDEFWRPSLDFGSTTSFAVALTGHGPLSPPPRDPAKRGALLELWIDKKAMTGLSAECDVTPVRIRLQRMWIASAGRTFMHVRTALVIVPVIHLAFVLILALLHPKSVVMSLILRALAPAGVATVAAFIFCDSVATILPGWLPYPSFSGSTLGLGLAFSGLSLSERWAAALLVVLAGIALTVLGIVLLGTLVSLVRLASRCVPGFHPANDDTAAAPQPCSDRWAWTVFWRAMPSALVTLAVALFVPHQVVLVVLLLVQLVLVGGLSLHETDTRSDALLLYLLFWLVPLRAPALFVWVRNMTFGWPSPAGIRLTSLAGMSEVSGDHNPFLVLPFFALVQRSVSRSLRFRYAPAPAPAPPATVPQIAARPFLRFEMGALLTTTLAVASFAPYKTYICYDVVCILTAIYWAASAQWRPARHLSSSLDTYTHTHTHAHTDSHTGDHVPVQGYTLSHHQGIEMGPLHPSTAPALLALPDGLTPPTHPISPTAQPQSVGEGTPECSGNETPSVVGPSATEVTSRPEDAMDSPSTRPLSTIGRVSASTAPDTTATATATTTTAAEGNVDTGVKAQAGVDRAITAYFDAVDVYEAEAARACTALERGFLSLAKARMEVPAAGLGTRIGKDGFDSRARKATVRVHIDHVSPHPARWRLVKVLPSDTDPASESEPEPEPKPEPEPEPGRQAACAPAPGDSRGPGQDKKVPPPEKQRPIAASARATTKRRPRPADPLYQFAALPPPALRRAQAQFRDALVALVGPFDELTRPESESEPQSAQPHASVLRSLSTLCGLEAELRGVCARAQVETADAHGDDSGDALVGV